MVESEKPRRQVHLSVVVTLLSLATVALSSSIQDGTKNLRRNQNDGHRFLQVAECDQQCCEIEYPPNCPGVEAPNPLTTIPLAAQIILIMILISLSGLFSGLTLGLMGLDKTGLEIVMDGDDERNAEYARRIYPLRKRGNLLLCTLLLGNTAVNALLSILLGDIAGGIVGFIASTMLIVIFGEILPQALCNRYALRIGSATVPVVRVIIILFLPISFPLAWGLDRLLGKELATTYSNAEMLKLLQIHVKENVLDKDTAVAMTGALKYRDIAVKDVMTKLDNTFMLSVDEKLSFETIAKIFQTGYSRIPVYEVNKNNVIGLLFVKDLIFIDPENETRVQDFIDIFGRSLHVVWVDDILGDVLRELKQGRSHMALVRDVNNQDERDPFYELKGIITLEDIIEEILGDEIVDETDKFVNVSERIKVDRAETFRWARLRLLDAKIVDTTLSFEEARAVTAHLWKNFSSVVSLLTERQLHKLVAETPVAVLPTAVQEVGTLMPSELIYEKGTPSDCCTLIVAGRVTVVVGDDNFRSDVSSWSLLGANALGDYSYEPDFSAWVSSGPCRCIRITRDRFATAVDASALERRTHPDGAPPLTASIAASQILEAPALDGQCTDDGVVGEESLGQMRASKMLAALQAVGGPGSVSSFHSSEPTIRHPSDSKPCKEAAVDQADTSGTTNATNEDPKL